MPDEELMIIPGATSLGRGFDIFGRISNQDSLLNPLIEMRSSDRVETIDGVKYQIPVYANVNRTANSEGTARFFSSRRKFESHFAAEASVEVSYGLFSAEFSAAYSSDRKIEESHSFALYDVKDTRYTLSLSDASFNQIKEDIRPGIGALPEVFTKENSEVFWKFFSKYGTHFTSQVELGGRLFYYASISKSYTSDETTANARMKAEYTGVFGGKVEASAAWKQADEKWMENREVHLKVAGGDSNILGALVPTHGVNKGELFTGWLQSIKHTPAVMRFKLRPISELAPENKERALDDAYQTFVGARISVRSEATAPWDGTSNMFVMGRPLSPPEPTENLPSLQIAVLDSQTLRPLENRRIYARAVSASRFKSEHNILAFNEAYSKAFDVLNKYQDSSHIVMIATSNMIGWALPSPRLALFLQSCGAGKHLEGWMMRAKGTTDTAGINYALIGYVGMGPGQGFEHIEYTRRDGTHVNFPIPLTIMARLVPMRANRSVQFRPTGGGREQVSMMAL